jgi:hypothetical protein
MDPKNNLRFSSIETTDKINRGESQKGSTSITLSIIAIILGIILFLVSQYESLGLPWNIVYGIEKYKELLRYTAIALNCFIPIISLIGVVFGIIAIIKNEPKIIKPIIGIVVNFFIIIISSCPLIFSIIYLLGPRS